MSTRSPARPGLGLFALLLAMCPPLHAQQLGSINGTVYTVNQRTTLEGARVALLGTPFVMVTNKRGEFNFSGLTPGKYIIQASAIGYGTLSSPIEVKPLETLEVAFEAEAETVRLPDVEVAERSNLPPEFLRRSRDGGGRYFFRADIEKRSPPTVGDLLRTVAGVRVSCRGPVCSAAFARSPRGCLPAYFMDGIPVDPSVVWLQPPRDLDGVEIYSGPSETPPELANRFSCGAIVLWTRQPPPRIRKDKKPKKPEPVKADTVTTFFQ